MLAPAFVAPALGALAFAGAMMAAIPLASAQTVAAPTFDPKGAPPPEAKALVEKKDVKDAVAIEKKDDAMTEQILELN